MLNRLQLGFPLLLRAGIVDLRLNDSSDFKTYLLMKGLGHDVMSLVSPPELTVESLCLWFLVVCKLIINLFRSTLDNRFCILKPTRNVFADRSKVMLFLWIPFFKIMFHVCLCLFLAAL